MVPITTIGADQSPDIALFGKGKVGNINPEINPPIEKVYSKFRECYMNDNLVFFVDFEFHGASIVKPPFIYGIG